MKHLLERIQTALRSFFYYLNMVLEGRDETCKENELQTKKLLQAMLVTREKQAALLKGINKMPLKPYCCRRSPHLERTMLLILIGHFN